MGEQALLGQRVHGIGERRSAQDVTEQDNLVIGGNGSEHRLDVLDILVSAHAVHETRRQDVRGVIAEHLEDTVQSGSERSVTDHYQIPHAVSSRPAVCRTALLFAEIIVAPGHVRYKKIVANGSYSSVNGSNYFCA